MWGKNQNGENGHEEGLDLQTAWSAQNAESLDLLLESPTFNEAALPQAHYTTPRVKFSRSEARAQATPAALESLEALWHRIDETELLISIYELNHNKRKAIREKLISKFNSIEPYNKIASNLTMRQYLQLRHDLIEMRREQYTLKDTYAEPRLIMPSPMQEFDTYIDYDAAPLKLNVPQSIEPKLFTPNKLPNPKDFSEEDLKTLSKYLWSEQSQIQIDFTNQAHLIALINSFCEESDDPSLAQLRARFEYYVSISKLRRHQKIILSMKMRRASNQQISDAVARECGHRYTLNYISTIYCKTIIPAIAEAAATHYNICQELFFPENFKTCIDCARTLLRDESNFMHKIKVKDGFSPRCKDCERAKRESKKETNK